MFTLQKTEKILKGSIGQKTPNLNRVINKSFIKTYHQKPCKYKKVESLVLKGRKKKQTDNSIPNEVIL